MPLHPSGGLPPAHISGCATIRGTKCKRYTIDISTYNVIDTKYQYIQQQQPINMVMEYTPAWVQQCDSQCVCPQHMQTHTHTHTHTVLHVITAAVTLFMYKHFSPSHSDWTHAHYCAPVSLQGLPVAVSTVHVTSNTESKREQVEPLLLFTHV